jgi:AraC family transcriptional regulator, regulatory protein of adaptative response / methylated-DNA-[protein]-cysteine methyltransferase
MVENKNSFHEDVETFFHSKNQEVSKKIPLHLKGTNFQIKVWEALLSIPEDQYSTYSNIAKDIGNPRAVRAVGTAIGDNPIAYIIPCHRVLRSSGEMG